MAKKRVSKKVKARKIQVSLPEASIRRLDAAAEERGLTRSSLAKALLESGSRPVSHDLLVDEAFILRSEAEEHEAAGRRAAAATGFLLAAAKELEAAASLSPTSRMEDEGRLKSALTMAVQLMKKGTGYRQLPDVPAGLKMSDSVQ